ncbi:MAG TPA: alpha/beta fold hydrolase [Burkholderiales bacterium]|nr:alpha/beta fold hydrolase [Burkholderiales bacterium]
MPRVVVEGSGPKTLVMIHGWPDTYRLWDGQVAALSDRYRCVRFTLPGFDQQDAKRAYTLDEVVETIRAIVEEHCPGARATLLLHDWGCFYGYQFAMRYPRLVERVVGVDIGDAGSRSHVAELGWSGKLMLLAYQVWLALAWRIGGGFGDWMARTMARLLRCPTDPKTIGSHMGYGYAVRWLGAAGGFKGLRVFKPERPMLFLYGERKPLMFHSRAWAERLATQVGCRVLGFPTGHWIMIGRPQAFNDALRSWLAETDGFE